MYQTRHRDLETQTISETIELNGTSGIVDDQGEMVDIPDNMKDVCYECWTEGTWYLQETCGDRIGHNRIKRVCIVGCTRCVEANGWTWGTFVYPH